MAGVIAPSACHRNLDEIEKFRTSHFTVEQISGNMAAELNSESEGVLAEVHNHVERERLIRRKFGTKF